MGNIESSDTSSTKSKEEGTSSSRRNSNANSNLQLRSDGSFKFNSGVSPKLSFMFQRVVNSSKRAMSPGYGSRIRRSLSTGSATTEGEWGFFEDFEPPTPHEPLSPSNHDNVIEDRTLVRALSLPSPATQAPMYVLESTLATQQLWYATAGQRPKQPQQEREYFESLWKRNFELSEIPQPEEKAIETTTITTTTTISATAPSSSSMASGITGGITSNSPTNGNKAKKMQIREEVPYKEFDGEILYRGKGPFSNAVSKSFPDQDISAMTLQVPRFRIVRAQDGDIRAEFLIVITVNSYSTVTFGLWKRHSDFNSLAMKVQTMDLKSGRNNSFKNALLSWQCLIHRKRWFRCLDKVCYLNASLTFSFLTLWTYFLLCFHRLP